MRDIQKRSRAKNSFLANEGGSLERLFIEANKKQDRRDFAAAFKLFELAALAGHVDAMNSLGYAFDVGCGVRQDKKKAMLWYRKASRRGNLCSYTNIGTIYRDLKNFKKAHIWFLKAFKKGDGDAALEIAKIYMRDKKKLRYAKKYLHLTLQARNVTDNSREQARVLLSNGLS